MGGNKMISKTTTIIAQTNGQQVVSEIDTLPIAEAMQTLTPA